MKDLKSIRALTDGPINDNILYLFLSTYTEIQVLHHLDLLGNRHSQELHAVGLCSLGNHAPSVEIDSDMDLVQVRGGAATTARGATFVRGGAARRAANVRRGAAT